MRKALLLSSVLAAGAVALWGGAGYVVIDRIETAVLKKELIKKDIVAFEIAEQKPWSHSVVLKNVALFGKQIPGQIDVKYHVFTNRIDLKNSEALSTQAQVWPLGGFDASIDKLSTVGLKLKGSIVDILRGSVEMRGAELSLNNLKIVQDGIEMVSCTQFKNTTTVDVQGKGLTTSSGDLDLSGNLITVELKNQYKDLKSFTIQPYSSVESLKLNLDLKDPKKINCQLEGMSTPPWDNLKLSASCTGNVEETLDFKAELSSNYDHKKYKALVDFSVLLKSFYQHLSTTVKQMPVSATTGSLPSIEALEQMGALGDFLKWTDYFFENMGEQSLKLEGKVTPKRLKELSPDALQVKAKFQHKDLMIDVAYQSPTNWKKTTYFTNAMSIVDHISGFAKLVTKYFMPESALTVEPMTQTAKLFAPNVLRPSDNPAYKDMITLTQEQEKTLVNGENIEILALLLMQQQSQQ